jgi:hypothetical protein
MGEISEELIEELYHQKLEGKSYGEIRAELAAREFKPEEIGTIIRKVDEWVLKSETENRHTAKAAQYHRIGLILAVCGLLITIGFNTGIIRTNLPPWLVYSPFLAGILMMFYGRMLQRNKSEPIYKAAGKIRTKRPYK